MPAEARRTQKRANSIENRIPHWGFALELRYAVPDPYMGKPEAQGSRRKPEEAVNTSHLAGFRLYLGVSASVIWFSVPDPLNWAFRKPRESRGSPQKL